MTSSGTENLISDFCDLNLAKPGGFYIEFGMTTLSLKLVLEKQENYEDFLI